MPTDIVVPPLSQTSDSLVFIGWLKQVGDRVTKGEALFEVETDKSTLEVEAPATGTLHEALAEPGTEVAVRARIGSIVGVDETAPAAATSTAANPAAPAQHDGPVNSVAAGPPAPAHRERPLASPRARRLADKEGLGLAGIAASGPRGLIVERDVRARLAEMAAERLAAESTPATAPASAAQVAAPLPVAATTSRRIALSATRRTIARRLQAQEQTSTPVTLTREVDATELAALRERLLLELAGQDVRPTYTDLLVAITARCLRLHPALNGTLDGDAMTLFEAVHMGLAVDTDRGLLVPVLRHADGKGLRELARERAALMERARAGRLTAEEQAGGTFTVTNLGGLGIDAFTPLLNPPQIAILGLGRVRPVARPMGNTIGVGQTLWLSLTFDHRAVDGAPAARLLGEIASLVEKPERVWL